MREADLYPAIRDYLDHQGYEVRGEVKHCDVAAIRDDELLIVELKLAANLTLLVQATSRQAEADKVFVAIPEPARPGRHFRGFRDIVRKLGLGLLTVRFTPAGASVNLHVEPAAPGSKRRNKRRNAIMEELDARSGDYNRGGTSGEPILTAYREHAIFIAVCLQVHGDLSPADIRALGGGPKTTSVLGKNYYGWFLRVQRGIYRLSPAGEEALRQYSMLRERCLARLAANKAT